LLPALLALFPVEKLQDREEQVPEYQAWNGKKCSLAESSQDS